MEDLKLWRIDRSHPQSPLAIALGELRNTETEKLLEDLLAKSPHLLEPNLRLIARQFQTDGGPLDLLGIDANDRLVIFELKRGTLVRDAVAQALDYASGIATMSPDAFAAQVTAGSGDRGIEKFADFAAWFGEEFGQPLTTLLKAPRIVLVGVGIDDATRRIVRHLASFGIDIAAVTFHAYEANGELLLARSIEVDATEVSRSNVGTSGDWSQGTLERGLSATTTSLGLACLFDEIRSFIGAELGLTRPGYANKHGVTFYRRCLVEGSNRPSRYYASLIVDSGTPDKLYVYFADRAIRDGGTIVDELVRETNAKKLEKKSKGYAEYEIAVDASTWPTLKPRIGDALHAIVRGTESRDEGTAGGE